MIDCVSLLLCLSYFRICGGALLSRCVVFALNLLYTEGACYTYRASVHRPGRLHGLLWFDRRGLLRHS